VKVCVAHDSEMDHKPPVSLSPLEQKQITLAGIRQHTQHFD